MAQAALILSIVTFCVAVLHLVLFVSFLKWIGAVDSARDEKD